MPGPHDRIKRTTANDPASRTHVWVHSYHVTGIEPGGAPIITIEMIEGFDSDPPNETWTLEGSYTQHQLTGGDATSFISANQTLFDDMERAMYQKLIDDSIEPGTIE